MNIEKYLVLNKYLLSLFGMVENRDLQVKLQNIETGEDMDGRSRFSNVLRSLEGLQRDKLSEETLLRYDQNILSYVKKINYKRDLITLKYFQYLGVLFTEIVLDNLKNRKIEFLYELNEFLAAYKQQEDIDIIDDFNEDDLKKLAFWMATGSGKTLIMHINYYQFMHYEIFSPDNIILITPNEGLSKQHYEEMQKSGIPCRLYAGNLSNVSFITASKEILVLEMTKLVKEKKGSGVTLSIDVFEGKNLIFVDEGHKGKASEEQEWAKRRNELAHQGFVFEYSATFGQILSEKNEIILREYAKSIIFDYSYKYFYLDGYGKDFLVLNVRQAGISQRRFQETMFVSNLLSFYQQLFVYEENKHLASEYNLEKPLWIFVGTTVTGKAEESDVVQIVDFFKLVFEDQSWVQEKINEILEGKTGLTKEDNEYLKGRFTYLKSKNFRTDDVYKKVFGGKGKFSVYELKNAEGEFGLRVGENAYFGVINIGSVSDFKRELENKGITVNQDAVSGSLFETIKTESSKITVLIGSKKFIEGWDTWRVASMGLLNIGKGQGPQIIQLFGRGVRLKGREFSLKRSGEKNVIQFLETVNIYGIQADYLDKFLDAIRKEEVEYETIEIPIKLQHENKWNTLYTLTKDNSKKFEEQEVLFLELDDKLPVAVIDLLPKVSLRIGQERGVGVTATELLSRTEEMRLDENIIELLDWQQIMANLYQFKLIKGYWNLVFRKKELRNLLLSDKYKILASSDDLAVFSDDDMRRLESIALLVIKKYTEMFYRKYAKQFETQNMYYDKVTKEGVCTNFGRGKDTIAYTIQIDKKEKDLIRQIKYLLKDLNNFMREDIHVLPRIYFDRHLYVPILLQDTKIKSISPVGLVKSESKFIEDLRRYLKQRQENLKQIEIYLLRNMSKSGVGFFYLSGYYPDFIMWVKYKNKQFVVFIDPKGLEHTKGLDDQKIKLSQEINVLEQALGKQDIDLESFVLSDTSYDKLRRDRTSPPSKEEYMQNHVLFLDDSDWPEKLFKLVLRSS